MIVIMLTRADTDSLANSYFKRSDYMYIMTYISAYAEVVFYLVGIIAFIKYISTKNK